MLQAYTGFGFQLNAYSPLNTPPQPGVVPEPETIVWQQYCIALLDTNLQVQISNWTRKEPAKSPSQATATVNLLTTLALTPTANTLPAGYHLEISLHNDPDGTSLSALFSGHDNNGNQLPPQPLIIAPLNYTSPIVAFQVVLVGPASAENVTLKSGGAGTITYSASSALTPSSVLPPNEAWIEPTGETSNSSYETMKALGRRQKFST
jgi:hypothetical protein